MSEDPKLKVKDIFNYAKEVDKSIAFSKWYRGDQTIKPRGQGANGKKESESAQKTLLEKPLVFHY